MGHYIQILVIIIIALILLWFGYSLRFEKGFLLGLSPSRKRQSPQPRPTTFSGATQTCPVCGAQLREGETIKSTAFPSLNGGKDRVMHIKGCTHCLKGEGERLCPVCGETLKGDEILVCRMFERLPGSGRKRSHVHVLGCTHCWIGV